MNQPSIPLWPTIAALLALVGLMAAGFFFFIRLLVRNTGGGWSRLLEQFAVDGPPDAQVFQRQTIQVGSVVFQRCANVGIGPGGLYLQAMWKKPLLVPWHAIASIHPTKLHWVEAYRLSVGADGGTAVTVKADLFEAMRPHLKNLKARESTLASAR